MTAVISAVFGGYDAIPEPTDTANYPDPWLMFTDDPTLEAPYPWEVVVLYPDHPAMQYDHPRMKTVWCKTQPWELVGRDWGKLIWIDANSRIISPTFVAEALAYADKAPFTTYDHPDRDCIYAEAEASMAIHPEKYHDQPLTEQVAHYRRRGHPEHGGLYAVGTCVYNVADPRVRLMCTHWLRECERWSYQTQLSLPYVARRGGYRVDVFNHHQIVGNPWMSLDPHIGHG